MGAPSDVPAPGTPRASILLVEDEMLIRMAAANAFREAGFIVIEARNADEALKYVEAGKRPEAVFTDVRMPGSIDGLQLVAQLKAALPTIAVLVTSGHLDADPSIAHPFLPKPYSLDEAVSRVVEALERRD